PDIDELIARERRRQRRRRWAAAVTGTAGVVGVVFGVALVTGHVGGARTPTNPGAEPNSGVTVPADETPEERYARLSELLGTRIAAVLPEVAVRSHRPDHPELFSEYGQIEGDRDAFPGYDAVMATLEV